MDTNHIPGGAATLLRYGLTVLGTYMITSGILPADSDLNGIVGAILVLASTGYGMWKTYDNKKKLIDNQQKLAAATSGLSLTAVK